MAERLRAFIFVDGSEGHPGAGGGGPGEASYSESSNDTASSGLLGRLLLDCSP